MSRNKQRLLYLYITQKAKQFATKKTSVPLKGNTKIQQNADSYEALEDEVIDVIVMKKIELLS
jgi:hypothetical protein